MNERKFNRMQTRRISRIPYANYFTWHNANSQNNASELETSVIPENATTETDESNSSSADDREISLLTEQIKDLRAEYISIQSKFLTMSTISFCGYGVIVYYACDIDSGNPPINYIFLILPFLFGISFMNILKYTVRMFRLGSHIAVLERAINAIVNKDLFEWHSKTIHKNGAGFIGIAAIPFNLALFAAVFLKFNENMEALKALTGKGNMLLYYSLLVLVIVSIVFIIISLYIFAKDYCKTKSPI